MGRARKRPREPGCWRGAGPRRILADGVLQRILLIVAVLYLVWRILAGWGRRLGREQSGADSFSRFSPKGRGQRRQSAAQGSAAPEELVACSRCGTYVPLPRALAAGDGSFFCSRVCREAGKVPAEHGGLDR
jgi:hypothetical protein